jgi:hypothetical protein
MVMAMLPGLALNLLGLAAALAYWIAGSGNSQEGQSSW